MKKYVKLYEEFDYYDQEDGYNVGNSNVAIAEYIIQNAQGYISNSNRINTLLVDDNSNETIQFKNILSTIKNDSMKLINDCNLFIECDIEKQNYLSKNGYLDSLKSTSKYIDGIISDISNIVSGDTSVSEGIITKGFEYIRRKINSFRSILKQIKSNSERVNKLIKEIESGKYKELDDLNFL